MKEINTYDDNLEGGELPDFRAVNPFTVPSDYFEEAAAHIKRVCQLPFVGDDVPLSDSSISPTYFEDLSIQIKLRISLEEILSERKASGFDIPADYFPEAEQEILSAVKLDTLVSTPQETTFQVDSQYFDSLSTRIKERIASESSALENKPEPAKVVSIRPWIKYTAAAACVLCILSIGAYFGRNSDQATSPVVQTAVAETSLSAISDDELVDYIAFNNDSDDLHYYVDYIYASDQEQDEDEVRCSELEDKDLEAYIKHML